MQRGWFGRFRTASVAAFLALVGLLVACGDPGGGAPVKIEALQAIPSTIVAGGQSSIVWRVTGDAVSIRLTSPEGELAHSLPAAGSVQVAPGETTLYTLVARNRAGGQVTRAVEVTVEPAVPVQIESFTATPATIAVGDSSTLAWEVSGDVGSVTISAGDVVVADGLAAVGSFDVTPVQTTEYTLVVSGEEGDPVSQNVTVVVFDAVVIDSFTATPATIAVGDSSTLAWEVSGDVGSVTISAGDVVVADGLAAVGSFDVTPVQTTEYTLVVSGEEGDPVSQNVTVVVMTPAMIDSFTATPTTILAGASSTLAWEASGDVESVTISAGGSVVADGLAATGSRVVSPAATTTYTLTVTDSASSEVTSTVTVVVVDPVHIDSFTATPATVGVGDSSTLAWEVSGDVESVTISAGGSVVADGLAATGSRVVSPAATTTYTLTVTDAFGAELTSTVTLTVLPLADVSGVTADVTTNSQIVVSWTVVNADRVDVVAVNATNPVDVSAIPGGAGLAGGTTTVTLPIPDGTHQVIRVVATNAVSSDSSESAALVNVVLNTGDYDPYDPEGDGGAEAPVAGTFRQVLANAAAGSVIGFASDVLGVGTIQLRGVEVGTWGDAHFLINKDITISAPSGGLVLEGVSGWEASDPGTAFSWRSRVLHVTASSNVVLDNITITGGAFIFKGAGIRNLGTLTMNGGAVTNNRAWHTGGGIHNLGTLTLNGTDVSGNVAATIDGEAGTVLEIRGNPAYTTGVIQVGGWGGGIYNEGGTVTLNAATVENNSARFTGGGVSNDIGSLTILGGTVSGNEASDSAYVDPGGQIKTGGGIYSEGALEVSGTTFASNDARGTVGDPAIGGALVVRTPGVANVTTSAFNDNLGDYSSAIHVWYCSSSTPESVLTLDDATSFSGNVNRIAGPEVGSTGITCPDAGPAGRGATFGRFLPDTELLEKGSFR